MNLLKRIARAPEMITFVLLLVALGIGTAGSARFLDASYLLSKTSDIVPIGFMALAMTFVIIAGQIDLSVASGALLTSICAAAAYEKGLSMLAVIPLAFGVGMLLGLFNGLLVAWLNLPSLVVTLGTLALYRGLGQGWIGNDTIKGFPRWFVGWNYVKLGIVPVPVVVWIVVAIMLALVLMCTTFGRRVFAIGTNESATRYSGISTGRTKLAVFMLSGLSMGAAALIQMSQIQTVDQKQFNAGELMAITAVVLGGTSIFGGRGSILGTVLAMLLLVAVDSAMGLRNMLPENKLAVIGTLLIASVLLSDFSTRLISHRRPKGSLT
jgi:rhamnose transport system permease protein